MAQAATPIRMDIPGYTIERTLGQGGMATVYLAIQQNFEREVALKVMAHQLSADPSFGERFLREARIVSKLMHPNIVTVYDVGEVDGHHYLAMEYIPGDDLKQARGQLSLRDSIQVIKEVARALDFAHRKGYVHRDVKPENIMLHGEDGRAILMDFGIARAADATSQVTKTGTAIGTPHYMSPEQAKGAAVDSRGDLYSLGVVLFVLLTGRVPFDADSAVAVGIKHLTDPIPTLPPALRLFQPVINTVLSKDPEHRYQTGQALIDDLDALDPVALDRLEADHQQRLDAALAPAAADAATVVADSVSDPLPTQAATQTANQAMPATTVRPLRKTRPADHLRVPEEDRRQPNPAAPRRGFPWLLTLLVLVLAGAGWWYRDQLPQWLEQWQGDAAPPAVVTSPEPAPPSAPAPPAAPAEPSPEALLAAALADAAALEPQVERDLTLAPQLAEQYRQALQYQPNHPDALAGLERLREQLTRAMTEAVENRDWAQASTLVSTVETLYPRAAELPRFQRIKERLNQAEQVQQHLARAEAQIAANRLTEPAEDNAVASYRAVLALVPNHPQARAGLQTVATRYGSLANNARQEGDLERALSFVRKGLEVAPLASLERQEQQLQQAIAARRDLRQTLARADSLRQQQQWLGPEGAVAVYRSVADQSAAARTALSEIEQTLAGRIRQQLAGGDLDGAETALQQAYAAYPNSDALLAVQMALDRAIEAARPKVPQLLVDGQPMTDLNRPQQPFAADRTVYIGFRYDNFAADTTVLQAQLFDAGRSVELAQVPVIVTGVAGEKVFRIDRPVQGFPEGGYVVDLWLDQERLASGTFSIDN